MTIILAKDASCCKKSLNRIKCLISNHVPGAPGPLIHEISWLRKMISDNELLNEELFHDLADEKKKIDLWKGCYNE